MLQLPADLQIQVLGSVDWRSLVRCSMVCRTLHDIIHSTSALKYTIELGCAGPADIDNNSLSFPARIERLKQQSLAWRDLNICQPTCVPLPGAGTRLYKARDGYIVTARLASRSSNHAPVHHSELAVLRSSGTADVPAAGIECHALDIPVQMFAIDPIQDLLVCVERDFRDFVSLTLGIHITSLTTSGSHPKAEHSLLEYALLDTVPHTSHVVRDIQTFGDILAILIISRACSRIVVWNWRVGIKLAEVRSVAHSFRSFVLLSKAFILTANHSARSFDVFYIERSAPAALHVKSFALPLFAKNRSLCHFTLLSGVSSSGQSEGDLMVGVVCVTMNIQEEETEYIWNQVSGGLLQLFTPLSTFLPGSIDTNNNSIMLPAKVPWHEWGPRATRIMPAPSGNAYCRHVHGWRCGMINYEHPRKIQILDFNQASLRRDLQFDTLGASEIVESETVLPAEDFFGVEDVVTSLPYRRTVTELDSTWPLETMNIFLHAQGIVGQCAQDLEEGEAHTLYVSSVVAGSDIA